MLDDAAVPLDPLAIALMRSAAAVEEDGDEPLRALMDQALQDLDAGEPVLAAAIQASPSVELAQRLDQNAWLSASLRTFETSAGAIAHLVFVVPVLIGVTGPLNNRRTDPASLAAFTAFEATLKDHELVRRKAVLWTLPCLYRPEDLLALSPSSLRRLNTAAFKRIKAARQDGWPAFDLDDQHWGAPVAYDGSGDHGPGVGDTDGPPVEKQRVELRFIIGGLLDWHDDALALWAQPDPDDEEMVAQWDDTMDLWKQDALQTLEQACGHRIATVFYPAPLNIARDGGVYAWHDFLFYGTLLNAKDRAGEDGVYATLHEVNAVNEALGAAGDWQDISAVAIELRRRDDDTLLDTFAWPHTGLGDDQMWIDAIVDTLDRQDLLQRRDDV